MPEQLLTLGPADVEHPEQAQGDANVPAVGAQSRASAEATSMLRWATAGYVNAQRDRIRYGEQLRAVLQGRDEKWGVRPAETDDSSEALKRIREEGGGPVPLLGLLYSRAWHHEGDLCREMARIVESHAAWPWLSAVRGLGPTLCARLLARLDISRAPRPSSFWAYCGLGTVPAELFACPTCESKVTAAPGTRLVAMHTDPNTGKRCSGAYRSLGVTDLVRAAQPRPRRGERAKYDFEAKQVCYLIGVSFVRCGGKYREHYDERREHLQDAHPEWPPKRVHLAAMRAAAKLFLLHLWVVWRDAVGDSSEPPMPGRPSPWDMVS